MHARFGYARETEMLGNGWDVGETFHMKKKLQLTKVFTYLTELTLTCFVAKP